MTDKKPIVLLSLYCGSLWGLTEATVGHILHWTFIPGLAGFVMFPIGLAFMAMAFKHSGKLSSIFLTAFVAANIKMADLIFPTPNLFAVVNPAIAILCESLAVMLVFSLKGFKQTLSRLDYVWGMAFIWRLVYGIGLFSAGLIFPAYSFFKQANIHIIQFYLIDSFISAALIYIVFYTLRRHESDFFLRIRSHSVFLTLGILLAAISVELLV